VIVSIAPSPRWHARTLGDMLDSTSMRGRTRSAPSRPGSLQMVEKKCARTLNSCEIRFEMSPNCLELALGSQPGGCGDG